jgi:hypothetical protein
LKAFCVQMFLTCNKNVIVAFFGGLYTIITYNESCVLLLKNAVLNSVFECVIVVSIDETLSS